MCPAPPDIYPLTHPLSRPAPLPIAAAATSAAATRFHRTRRSEDIIDIAVAQPGEDVNRFSEVLRIAQVLDHPIGRATACVQIDRSEEHTSELQSLMRISYAVFCLKTTNIIQTNTTRTTTPSI